MKTPNASRVQRLLEEALLAAIDVVADLEESEPRGDVTLTPTVITWMVTQNRPELMLEVDDHLLGDTVARLITDYTAIHLYARAHLTCDARHFAPGPANYPPPPVRVTTDDLEDALRFGMVPTSPAFGPVFSAISSAVQDRFEMMDAIEWGDPDDEPIVRKDDAKHFDHQAKYEEVQHANDDLVGSDRPPAQEAADRLMNCLADADDGRHEKYWSAIDVQALEKRLAMDWDALTQQIHQEGRIPELQAILPRDLECMQRVETQWRRLGAPFRFLLEKHADAREATELICSAIRTEKDAVSNHSLHQAVYWMFCRRLRATDRHPLEICDASRVTSEVMNAISHDTTPDTCYLVDASAIYGQAAVFFCHERHCLVVKLPEERRLLLDELSVDNGLNSVFFKRNGEQTSQLFLTPNRAFWAPEQELLKHLRHFRLTIPVVYLFDGLCAIATYRFNPFIDVQKLAHTPYRDRPSVVLSEGEWRHAAANYVSTLPDGTQLTPTIFTSIKDMTTGRQPLGALSVTANLN